MVSSLLEAKTVRNYPTLLYDPLAAHNLHKHVHKSLMDVSFLVQSYSLYCPYLLVTLNYIQFFLNYNTHNLIFFAITIRNILQHFWKGVSVIIGSFVALFSHGSSFTIHAAKDKYSEGE